MDIDFSSPQGIKASDLVPPSDTPSKPEARDENAEVISDYGGLVYAAFERERFYVTEAQRKPDCHMELERPDVSSRPKRPKLDHGGPVMNLTEVPFTMDAEFHLDVKKIALPDPSQVLNALTTAKASDGFNLERLEVIGDSFLKLSSYIHMFFHFPKRQEGYLTQLCDQQVWFELKLKLSFNKITATALS